MDVLMPQLGETVAEGKITQWFKSPGEAVKPGDNLFEIETDKTSMDVPATAAGVLAEIRAGVGESLQSLPRPRARAQPTPLGRRRPRTPGAPPGMSSRLPLPQRQPRAAPSPSSSTRSSRCARPPATTAPHVAAPSP
jgi:pyruvate/2-oxoglutarate dehydrogenase complex dihydrolipoamide acyltransferase (E2) component